MFVFGDIGSGKSSFCAELAKQGASVISSDDIVADLYRSDTEMVGEIEEILEMSVRDSDGNVDKRRIADKIFADAALRERVERVVHPRVTARLQAKFRETLGTVVVYEVSALKRDADTSAADVLVEVVADDAVRLHRLMARGMAAEEARLRMASQAADTSRMNRRDLTVVNNGSREELMSEARRLYAAWSASRD